jgi:hypothetical protein
MSIPNYSTRSGVPDEGSVQPDYSGFDSVDDILRDVTQWGLLEELRARLCGLPVIYAERAGQMARDIAYELAGARNRSLAVDVLLNATGIAEFGATSLRDYANRNGCSHEWFRQEVNGMRKRLNIDVPGLDEESDGQTELGDNAA